MMEYYNIEFSKGDKSEFVTMLEFHFSVQTTCARLYEILRLMGATDGLIRAYAVKQTVFEQTKTEIGFVRLCDDEFTYRELY